MKIIYKDLSPVGSPIIDELIQLHKEAVESGKEFTCIELSFKEYNLFQQEMQRCDNYKFDSLRGIAIKWEYS